MNKFLRRVVITGTGMVSPLGASCSSSWARLLAGESGIVNLKSLPEANNETFPNDVYIAPVHSEFDRKKHKIAFTPSLTNSFLIAAAEEAMRDAGWEKVKITDKGRFGTSVGSMNTNLAKFTDSLSSAFTKGFNHINRLTMLNVLTNMGTAHLSVKYGFQGPSITLSTACATGASAIGEAYRMIQLDEADFMLAGGSDEVVNPVCVHAAIKMQAMNTKTFKNPFEASRPFDRDRAGFILGEGAGVLVLEELSHALSRNARIYAEILGYGCTSDGYHLVKPLEDGSGGLRAMQRCLAQSGVKNSEIDHINCHATSTPVGDEAEARAIISLLRDNSNASVTANKGAIGHCFAAAGAIESIFALKSLEENVVPEIKNLVEPVLGDQVGFVRGKNKKQEINKLIKNSFGFGGVNVALLFGKYQGKSK